MKGHSIEHGLIDPVEQGCPFGIGTGMAGGPVHQQLPENSIKDREDTQDQQGEDMEPGVCSKGSLRQGDGSVHWIGSTEP